MLRGVQRRRGGRAWMWLLIGLMIGGACGAGAVFFLKREKGGIPGGTRFGQADELALVPTDSIGFVHIRVRDTWNSELFKELHDIVLKAGPKALQLLDDGFAPAPSTLERVTLVFLPGKPANPLPKTPTPKAPAPSRPGPPKPPGPLPKFAPGELPGPASKSLIDMPENIETVGVLAFTAEFDESKVRLSLIPEGITKEVAGKTYWEDESNKMAVFFPSKTVLVAGSPAGVNQFVSRQNVEKQPEGPLSGALELAATGGRNLVGAISARTFHVNIERLKDEFHDLPIEAADAKELAKNVEPLLHAEAFAIGLSLMGPDDSKVDVRAYFADEKRSEDAEQAVRSLSEFAQKKLAEPKKELEEKLKPGKEGNKTRPIRELPEAVLSLLKIGAIEKVGDYLKKPPLERKGKELVATFELPSIAAAFIGSAAASAAMFFPAVGNVQAATEQTKTSNNLKQIGLAMLNHAVSYDHYPESAPRDKNDGSQLSWRVQLLPYLDEVALYQEFNLKESWYSPHNKKLIERMPKVYQSPPAKAPPGQTYYKVFSGNGAIFGPGKKTRLTDITDGTANTILVVEGGEPVIWTKPDDINFDPNKMLPNLSLMGNRRINIVMADGTVRSVNLDKVSEKTLKAAITMAGGEDLPLDW